MSLTRDAPFRGHEYFASKKQNENSRILPKEKYLDTVGGGPGGIYT